MRVKMILDLIANTGKGADKARKDLKGVKDAAKALKGSAGAGPDKLRKDLERLTPAARKAAKELAIAGHRERQIGRDSGVAKTTRQLEHARRTAKRLNTELRATPGASFAREARLRTHGRQIMERLDRKQARRAVLSSGGTATGARGRQRAPASSASAMAPEGASGAALMAAGRGLAPMFGAYMGWQGVKAVSRNTVGKSISFEAAMADVKRKVDLPDGGSFEQIEEWINKAAIRFGKSRTEVANLVAELGAAGVAYEDLSKAIELNTKASVAWDMTAGDTGNTMAKIRAGQNLTMTQLEEFGDKVNAIADAGASKESDLVEMYQRAGASGEISGLDMDTSLAFLAGMNSAGIQPEIAARGYAAMMSKLRVANTAGTDAMEEGFKLLGLTGDQVEQGMKKDAKKTLHDFIARFQAAKDQAGAATLIFGQGWWDEFARMVQAMPEIQKYLGILGDRSKWQGSMGKSLNIELETTDNHLKRLEALTSKIGDNLGRWMLPGINAGVNKVVEAMDKLDAIMKRGALLDDAAKRQAEGQALTPAQRAAMADDESGANQVGQAASERVQRQIGAEARKREQAIAADLGDNSKIDLVRLRARNLGRLKLDKEIEGVARSLALGDPTGSSPMYRAQRDRLAMLRGQRGRMGALEAEPTTIADDPRVVSLQDEQRRLRERLARQGRLAETAERPEDASGFAADATDTRRKIAASEHQLRRHLAPQLAAVQRWGFGGAWGAPVGEGGDGAIGSSGLTAFGLNGGGLASTGSRSVRGKGVAGSGANWASALRSDLDVDLGPAGMTMMEKLGAGIRSGGAAATGAASAVGGELQGAFAGVDLSNAGIQIMASLAAGIRSGGAQAIAAAAGIAAQVRGAAAGGGAGRIGGALHDGVE
ncbi:phage tail tape measure protein [Camelimonas lactis]|nr:phage tail tape measure protein [Camelimonas lactis]